MVRPKCPRMIKTIPEIVYFKPRAIPISQLQEIVLSYDELEAIRLADLGGLYQEDAAIKMKISRPTFGRIISSAHNKIADALINGKAIRIEGGVIKMANKRVFICLNCEKKWEVPFGTGRPKSCPNCKGDNFRRADKTGHGGKGRSGACRNQGNKNNSVVSKEDK
jgi:uncharacterized protein